MHNLHFILVRASSGEKACQDAESQIIEWGTENNWRTMCGAVSEDNEVYDAGDGRYRPNPAESDLTSIEQINECVNKWLEKCFYGSVAKEKFEKNEFNLDEWNAHELWSLSKYAEHLSEAVEYKGKSFDVLKDTFFSYKYDECGVTNMVYGRVEDDEESMAFPKEKIWVVFCDMHS